jgi:antitoxin (DNA-binding transcriptional repressor) of toxin-antitoxin stability system
MTVSLWLAVLSGHALRRCAVSADHKTKPVPSSNLDARPVIEVEAGVFKDTCLSLLQQVKRGEFEIIVTRDGAPVARVVAESGAAPSAHGFMRGTVLEQGDATAPDFQAWGDLG